MMHTGKLVSSLVAKNLVSKNFARSYICTPPRVRVSFAEKVTHGVVFTVAILAIPTYISVNIKNYRGNPE